MKVRSKKEEKIKKREDNQKKKNIRIGFWNVAGLRKKDNYFWDFIAEYDIIGLTETWIEEKTWDKWKVKMPKEWNWRIRFAIRTNKKGRAKGGIITGVKKTIEEDAGDSINEINIQERKVKIDGRVWRILTVYSEKNDEKDVWEILRERMDDQERDYVVVGGDFNARIGNLGEMIAEDEEEGIRKRISRDKTIDRRGRKLIEECEEKGWSILNGNIEGDRIGEFTYMGETGESVIDYAIMNCLAINKVELFSIELRPDSDHMPLTVEIREQKEVEKEKTNKEEIKFIQVWNEEGKTAFLERIKEVKIENLKEIKIDELNNIIRSCVTVKKMRKNKGEKAAWWDRECKMKRNQVNKSLLKSKSGKLEVEQYRKVRKEYKLLCKAKKELKRTEYEEEIRNIKKEADIWKYVNKFRNSRVIINEDITRDEWMKYFMDILEGENEKEEIRDSEVKTAEEEDQEIKDEEIEAQLKKLKKNKAPGEDDIKNEALIYLEGDARTCLKEKLKQVWRGEGYPERWRKGIINPIFKKGDDRAVENYRGVTLLNTEYKLYAMVLGERLKVIAERILPDSQAGFRKGKSAMDNIYILNRIVEQRIRRPGGKLVAFFVDFKAAFDTMDRKILWETMKEKKVDEGLIRRIREIYKETVNTVRVQQKETQEFWTKKGVRQGCPLSPTLFAIYLADIDDYLEKRQDGGIVLGKRKIWTLSYADDVVLLAKDEREMNEMIRNLENYVQRKKLTLNVNKSKILIFKKGRGKKEKIKWSWRGERIEEVKKFKYLGYTFTKNNKADQHIKEIVKKGIIAMRKTWGIGESILKDDFNKRMMMFDYLVKSIILYGAEIWGWTERKQIETVQERYIRWVLSLDRCTPGYVVREETKRTKLRVETGLRCWKFEEKMRRSGNMIVKECIEQIDREANDIKGCSSHRREYFERVGWSWAEIKRMMEVGMNVAGELKKRDEALLGQEQWNKIQNARYNKRYKELRTEELPSYLKERGHKNSQGIIARFRCGNEERINRYWQNTRECRICGAEEENIDHIRESCLEELRCREGEAELLGERGEGVMWMRKVRRMREEAKKESNHGNN